MLISLYRGASCWVVVPAFQMPPALALEQSGPLIFKGTVPANLVSREAWPYLSKDLQRQHFSRVNPYWGAKLLGRCVRQFGTPLIPTDRPIMSEALSFPSPALFEVRSQMSASQA